FVVVDGLDRNYGDKGVVNERSLLRLLRAYLAPPKTGKRPRMATPLPSKDIVFAAMPFDRQYDDTFFVAMTHAARRVNAACKRVDRTDFTGDVVSEIRRLIETSIAVLVDLSEVKPNVLYEAGYAHALLKPSVHICS